MSMIEILINKKGRSFEKGVNNHKTSKVSKVFLLLTKISMLNLNCS